jgi:WD40 repeat protein
MKAILTFVVGTVSALTCIGVAAQPSGTVKALAPSLNQKLKITPEAPHGGCSVLHFLSDKRLLVSHDRTGPSIWDATTGRLERKLPIPGGAIFYRQSYVTPDGTWVVDRFYPPEEGLDMQFGVWDLSKDRRVVVTGPNMQGNDPYVYITRDKKTLWAMCSANPLSSGFNQVRLKFSNTDPLSVTIESKGKSGEEGVPHYHCATENLLIYFLETSPDTRGMTLCVSDLETLPQSSPRRITLKGHSPKSFWRMYQTSPADPGRPPYSERVRVMVDGILEDRYTEPAWKAYGCLAVPQWNELYVLVPYSKQLRGDTEGMRLTIIDTKETLKEKLNFDLPLVKIQGMALHPQKPILFCVTPDDRLLVIDTLSRAIVKEVRLKERVSRLEFEGMNPAVSPDGRLVAIANADGTISVFDFSE